MQHCFNCRPSLSTVSEDAGIEPRSVASTALAVRRSNHSATVDLIHIRLDLIHCRLRCSEVSKGEEFVLKVVSNEI
jgi:hypothetical protein